MTTPSALLIGSLPFEDETACMRRVLDTLGPYLFSLPDGEVGDKSPAFPKGNRFSWVMYAVERLTADAASWQVVKPPVRGADGLAVNYAAIQKLKPQRTPAELPAFVTLGYDDYARASYAIFQDLRQEFGLAQLKFQMGIPTGFAMGFAFASQRDWLRYTGAFNTVLARETNHMLREAGDDLLLQIEVPPELYAAYKLPAPLMSLALRPIYDLVRKITPGAQIGIHLCLGDFHNQALLHPKTLRKMVAFTNRLVDHWPPTHRLAYIHYPLAEGAVPPPLTPEYYQPLGQARLPRGTRFVAGFVHEKLSLDDHLRILDAVEQARSAAVDVACSCGLGRRTTEAATQALDLTHQLVNR